MSRMIRELSWMLVGVYKGIWIGAHVRVKLEGPSKLIRDKRLGESLLPVRMLEKKVRI